MKKISHLILITIVIAIQSTWSQLQQVLKKLNEITNSVRHYQFTHDLNLCVCFFLGDWKPTKPLVANFRAQYLKYYFSTIYFVPNAVPALCLQFSFPVI